MTGVTIDRLGEATFGPADTRREQLTRAYMLGTRAADLAELLARKNSSDHLISYLATKFLRGDSTTSGVEVQLPKPVDPALSTVTIKSVGRLGLYPVHGRENGGDPFQCRGLELHLLSAAPPSKGNPGTIIRVAREGDLTIRAGRVRDPAAHPWLTPEQFSAERDFLGCSAPVDVNLAMLDEIVESPVLAADWVEPQAVILRSVLPLAATYIPPQQAR